MERASITSFIKEHLPWEHRQYLRGALIARQGNEDGLVLFPVQWGRLIARSILMVLLTVLPGYTISSLMQWLLASFANFSYVYSFFIPFFYQSIIPVLTIILILWWIDQDLREHRESGRFEHLYLTSLTGQEIVIGFFASILRPLVIVAFLSLLVSVGYLFFYWGHINNPLVEQYGASTRVALIYGALFMLAGSLAWWAPDVARKYDPITPTGPLYRSCYFLVGAALMFASFDSTNLAMTFANIPSFITRIFSVYMLASFVLYLRFSGIGYLWILLASLGLSAGLHRAVEIMVTPIKSVLLGSFYLFEVTTLHYLGRLLIVFSLAGLFLLLAAWISRFFILFVARRFARWKLKSFCRLLVYGILPLAYVLGLFTSALPNVFLARWVGLSDYGYFYTNMIILGSFVTLIFSLPYLCLGIFFLKKAGERMPSLMVERDRP